MVFPPPLIQGPLLPFPQLPLAVPVPIPLGPLAFQAVPAPAVPAPYVPFHRFEKIDMQGNSSGQCDVYPNDGNNFNHNFHNSVQAQADAQQMLQDKDTLIPDSFITMLFDSNVYRRDLTYFAWVNFDWDFKWKDCVVLVLHSVYGLVNAVVALAKMVFHSFVLLFRKIQLCNQATRIAEKRYLEANYPINHENISFLKKRLSYLEHRDETIGNLIIFCRSIIMTIPIFGMIGQLLISLKVTQLREQLPQFKISSTQQQNAFLYYRQNSYRRDLYYRSPTEKTFIIEKLAENDKFEEMNEGIHNNLNEHEQDPSREIDGYNNAMPESIMGMISDYAKPRMKKEYWQKETEDLSDWPLRRFFRI